ncbi:hypothetical protein LXL04_001708 [Taraxacum kok-saghyz]
MDSHGDVESMLLPAATKAIVAGGGGGRQNPPQPHKLDRNNNQTEDLPEEDANYRKTATGRERRAASGCAHAAVCRCYRRGLMLCVGTCSGEEGRQIICHSYIKVIHISIIGRQIICHSYIKVIHISIIDYVHDDFDKNLYSPDVPNGPKPSCMPLYKLCNETRLQVLALGNRIIEAGLVSFENHKIPENPRTNRRPAHLIEIRLVLDYNRVSSYLSCVLKEDPIDLRCNEVLINFPKETKIFISKEQIIAYK